MEYVFVVTYGRSGSTALQNVLNAIDGYCIRGENGGIASKLAEAAHILHEFQIVHGPENTTPQDPWYGIAEVEPAQWKATLAERFTNEVLRPPEGTRVIGFKEVRYMPHRQSEEEFHITMDFLTSAFPGARVVFNTRNAVEVSQSGWWRTSGKFTPKQVEGWVAEADRRFNVAKAKLGERAFMIDHAQYKGNPDGFLPLLEWLGEELPRETLEEIGARKLTHLSHLAQVKTPAPQGLKSRLLGLFRS